MKLPRPHISIHIPAIIDAEDIGILGTGIIYAALFVGAAGAAGLAWTVFQWAGGL